MAIEGQRIGRYVLYDRIASGGMASVHFGRMVGPGGFARTVVIKRLHAHLVQDADFAAMFLDEGHLAARIHHPNVVPTIDVAALDGELLLVMEYVRGESLSRILSTLQRAKQPIPPPMLSSIVLGVLYGLEAAHEAKTESGSPLGIVHRDISPQNVMVGADGLARVADFGVAKAAARSHSTRDGKVKGKLAFMAPEQLARKAVDRRADLYAVGVILWEALAGRKLFQADDAMAVMHAVLHEPIPPLSSVAPATPPELARVAEKALSREPDDRWNSALEMAEALEIACPPALQRQVGAWVVGVAGATLAARDRMLAAVETSTPSEIHASPPVPEHLVHLSEQPTSLAIRVGEGASVVTELSVSSEVTPRRAVWGRGLKIAGGAGSVLVLGAVLFAYRSRSSSSDANAAATATPFETSPSAVASEGGAPLPSAAPAASAPPQVAPASAAEPLHASPRPKPAVGAGARPVSPPPRAKSSRPAACDPPFVVGADGIERFKPGCL